MLIRVFKVEHLTLGISNARATLMIRDTDARPLRDVVELDAD